MAVDEGSLLVRTAKLTPANVAETVVADELIIANSDGGAIYADKAYDTHARRGLLAKLGLKDGIMQRPNKHHALTHRQRRRNAALSKVRCSVETVFAVLKQVYGYRRTRFVGLIRNQLQLTLLAICFNLRRMLVIDHARPYCVHRLIHDADPATHRQTGARKHRAPRPSLRQNRAPGPVSQQSLTGGGRRNHVNLNRSCSSSDRMRSVGDRGVATRVREHAACAGRPS